MIESEWETRLEELAREFPDQPRAVLEELAKDDTIVTTPAPLVEEDDNEVIVRKPSGFGGGGGRQPSGIDRFKPAPCPFCGDSIVVKNLTAHIDHMHPGAREGMRAFFGTQILLPAWWLNPEAVEAGRANIKPRRKKNKLGRPPKTVEPPKPKPATQADKQSTLMDVFLEAVYGKGVVPLNDIDAIVEWKKATTAFFNAVSK